MNGPEPLTGNMMQSIICEMMLFLMLFLILGAVPFQPFLSALSPLLAHTLLFMSLLTFISMQFINLISVHGGKGKEGLLGGGGGGVRAHNLHHPPLLTVMHLY